MKEFGSSSSSSSSSRLILVGLSLAVIGSLASAEKQAPVSGDHEEISLATSIYVSAAGSADIAAAVQQIEKQHKSSGESVQFDDSPQGLADRYTETDDRPASSESVAKNSPPPRQTEGMAAANGTGLMINNPSPASASSSSGVQNLNGGFLVLFDEITKMKNNSINALIRLQYFDNNSLNKQQNSNNNNNYSRYGGGGENYQRLSSLTPMRGNNQPANPFDKDTNRPGSIRTTQNGSPNMNRQGPSKVFTKVLTVDRKQQQQQSLAARIQCQLSTWFESLNRKVGSFFKALTGNLLPLASVAPNQRQQQQQSSRIVTAIRPQNTGQSSFDHELTKRQTSIGQEDGQPCVGLKQNQLARCRSIELLVSYNLNNSFPGTLRAIEDNCHHISNLLADCWPQQLQYLRNSLASWNETVLSMTDFPLPSSPSSSSSSLLSPLSSQNLDESDPNLSARPPTCGVTPQLPGLVMDRINWMWLNLCMDKKFRLDYVENLKCLSLWTQERAQAVCSSEYKRMQMNLRSPLLGQYPTTQQDRRGPNSPMVMMMRDPDDGGPQMLTRQPRGIDFVPSINIATSTIALTTEDQHHQQQQRQQQQVQSSSGRALDGLNDREIESKILCCIFDLFLRCVNRQAVRDCGRHGGQFVVNFMSRIGTDDMKYLCNSEPRPVSPSNSAISTVDNIQRSFVQQQSASGPTSKSNQRSGPKRNNALADRSPFIQGNYCTDTRIVAVLYGKSVELYGDKSGHSHASANSNHHHVKPTMNGDHFGNRHHTQQGANYDPNLFDRDTPADSSACGLMAVLPPLHFMLFVYILSWIVNLI